MSPQRLDSSASPLSRRIIGLLRYAPNKTGRLLRVPSGSRRLLSAEVVVSVLATSVLMSLSVPQGVLARRLGASSWQLTLLSMSIFLGFLFTRAGRRLTRFINNGVAIFALRVLAGGALGLVYFVHGPMAFVGVMIVFRILDGATEPSQKTIQRDFYPAQARGTLVAWVRIVAVVAAMGLSWFIGSQLDRSQEAFRWLFPAMGALLVVGSSAFLFVPDRATRRSHNRDQVSIEEWDVFREDRRYRRFLIVFFIGTFAEKMLMPLQPILLADRFDTSYRDLATVFGIAGPMAGIVGYWFFARIITERNAFWVLAGVFTIKALRPVLFALAPAGEALALPPAIGLAGFEPLSAGKPFMLYLAVGEVAFRLMISGLELASLIAILGMADARQTPVYISLHFFFIALRGIAGPLIGNSLYVGLLALWPHQPGHAGLRAIYLLSDAVVLVGAAGMVWLARKEGRAAGGAGAR